MTGQRTMNAIIHAAFRRDLRRFDGALGSFPAGSGERAVQLKAAWDHFAYQLRLHHEDEEAYFWPALRDLGAGEALVGDLHGEHETMLGALQDADVAMAVCAGDPSADNAAAARAAVAQLDTVVQEHLVHEERDLEPLAATHRGTPQMKAAAASARKSHTEGGGPFFAWLSDDIAPDEAAVLRKEIPAPVLFMLSRLGRRGYQRRIAGAWSR